MHRKNVYIVGVGEMGSRHLQALRGVRFPLAITAIEPFARAREIAKERFESAPTGNSEHTLTFLDAIPTAHETIDLAIVATTAATRRATIETLLAGGAIKNFLLEKLLFQKPVDYSAIGALLKKSDSNAWVNCRMRIIPAYRDMKHTKPFHAIRYHVEGTDFGIATSIVHFLDHIVYLTGCSNFTINTDQLEPKIIPSKRTGFFEVQGTVTAHFSDGSVGTFTHDNTTIIPLTVTIKRDDETYIVNETTQTMTVIKNNKPQKKKTVPAPIPFQSTMTTWLTEEILSTRTCSAVTYDESAKIHLTALEPLRQFLNAHTPTPYEYFPFT